MKSKKVIVFIVFLFLIYVIPLVFSIILEPPALYPFYLQEKNITTTEFWTEYYQIWEEKALCYPKINLSSCRIYKGINIIIKNQTKIIGNYQEICFNGKCVNASQWDVWCWEDDYNIWCKDLFDSDARHHIPKINPGETYFYINKTITAPYFVEGHRKEYHLEDIEGMKK